MYFDHIPPAAMSVCGGGDHICVQVHMCVCKCMHIGVPACRGQRTISGVISQKLPTLFFQMEPLTDLELAIGPNWLPNKLHRPTCLHAPDSGITNTCYHTHFFFTWVLGIDLRSSFLHSNILMIVLLPLRPTGFSYPLTPAFSSDVYFFDHRGAVTWGCYPLWEPIIPFQWILQEISSQTHLEACLLIDSRSNQVNNKD